MLFLHDHDPFVASIQVTGTFSRHSEVPLLLLLLLLSNAAVVNKFRKACT